MEHILSMKIGSSRLLSCQHANPFLNFLLAFRRLSIIMIGGSAEAEAFEPDLCTYKMVFSIVLGSIDRLSEIEGRRREDMVSTEIFFLTFGTDSGKKVGQKI